MTEPEKTSERESIEVNIEASGEAQITAVGKLQSENTVFQVGDLAFVLETDPIPLRFDSDDWIERTQPQTHLTNCIQSERVRLVEIVAAGGFGKSCLASWIFDQFGSQFEHAIWLNFRKAPSFDVFGRWIHQETKPPIPPDKAVSADDLINQTIYRLTKHRCLLILDQLETLNDSGERPLYETFLEKWQTEGNNSTVIVTTRNSFVSYEQIRYVLTGFTPQEGAAFLDKKKIAATEKVSLEQLSTLADGHPLLLNLAASWLKQTAAGQLSETGLSFFERLFQNNLGDPEAKVEEIFQLLLQQLPEMLQTALLEVSVYQNPFDVERVQAMQAQVTEVDLELLEMRDFLLKRQDLWTLHPLVRQFAEETLRERQLETGAHQKAVEFFTIRMQGETKDINDWLAAFHHYCELGNYEVAYDLMEECYGWLDLRGYYRILVYIYERLTTAWKKHLPTAEAERKKFSYALGNLGNAYRLLGQYGKAIELHQQALTIDQEIGDRKGEAANLSNLGGAYHSQGQYDKAIDLCQQALTIHQEIGDRKGEAANLSNLGGAYHSQGQYDKAIDLCQQALTIHQEIGDRNGQEADNLGNLGTAYRSLGQYGKAIELYEQAP